MGLHLEVDEHGDVVCATANLVARDFGQRPGIDLSETFPLPWVKRLFVNYRRVRVWFRFVAV